MREEHELHVSMSVRWMSGWCRASSATGATALTKATACRKFLAVNFRPAVPSGALILEGPEVFR